MPKSQDCIQSSVPSNVLALTILDLHFGHNYPRSQRGLHAPFNYLRINYPKITLMLTPSNFFELDFLAGCNGILDYTPAIHGYTLITLTIVNFSELIQNHHTYT